MVPLGTNRAASLPAMSAASCWRRLTVGSSLYTSSPTSAVAMAARISAVGRVTVSLRMSMMRGAGVVAVVVWPLVPLVPLAWTGEVAALIA